MTKFYCGECGHRLESRAAPGGGIVPQLFCPACDPDPVTVAEALAAPPTSIVMDRAGLTLTLKFGDAAALCAFYDHLVLADENRTASTPRGVL